MVRIAIQLIVKCIVFHAAVLRLLIICFEHELLELNDLLLAGICSEDYGSEPPTAQDLAI